MIEQCHPALIHRTRVDLRSIRYAALSIDAQEFWSDDGSPSSVRRAWFAMNPGVVAGDVVMAFTAIDQVLIVMAVCHTMTTDDIVITRFAVHAIASLTTDDDVFTSSGQNEIVTAEVDRLRGDRGKREVRRKRVQRKLSQTYVSGDATMISKDQIVSTTRAGCVIGGSGNDQIVARTAGDIVVSADGWIRRFDCLNGSVGRKECSSIVTQNNVVAADGRDVVIGCSAENQVIIDAGTDRVISSDGWIDCSNRSHLTARVKCRGCVVTQNDIASIGSGDRIIIHAPENGVVVDSRGDRVGTANCCVDTVYRKPLACPIECNATVVAQNKIHAVASIQCVAL